MKTTTEKHVRYASDKLADLTAAWAFVMTHVDEFPTPHVEISPMWVYSDEEDGTLYFTATVSGNVDE